MHVHRSLGTHWNALDISSIHIMTCVYYIYIYIYIYIHVYILYPITGCENVSPGAGDPRIAPTQLGALREGLSTTLLGFGPVNFVEDPDTYPTYPVTSQYTGLLAALAALPKEEMATEQSSLGIWICARQDPTGDSIIIMWSHNPEEMGSNPNALCIFVSGKYNCF